MMNTKTFVTRFKKTLSSFGAMGEMILIMEIEAATPEELGAVIDNIAKSRMPHDQKLQALSFVTKYMKKEAVNEKT